MTQERRCLQNALSIIVPTSSDANNKQFILSGSFNSNNEPEQKQQNGFYNLTKTIRMTSASRVSQISQSQNEKQNFHFRKTL